MKKRIFSSYKMLVHLIIFFTFAMVLIPPDMGITAETLAVTKPGATRIYFSPIISSYDNMLITVSGPEGIGFNRKFKAGKTPFIDRFDPSGNPLPDGKYTYELRANLKITPDVSNELSKARESGDYSIVSNLQMSGKLSEQPLVQYGNFSVSGGILISPSHAVESAASDIKPSSSINSGTVVPMDVVHIDDLIVVGSLCVGLDCVNGENFGFDTMRLKENNLRIKFDDTSSTASFPTNDWQITINDSSNGGLEKFSIDDISNSRTPFTILAGARSNALFVHNSNRIGIGTSAPIAAIHAAFGDTPTLRLDQDGSEWPAQIWDVAGNEANFFVRDATNGSKLPFRIQPKAPTNSLFIKENGDIGIGINLPESPVHVKRSDGSARMLIDETSATTQNRQLIELRNNGSPQMKFVDINNTVSWNLGLGNQASFIIKTNSNNQNIQFTKGGRLTVKSGTSNTLDLSPTGNLTIAGILTQNSDVNSKENFVSINSKDFLARLNNLNISTWNYKADNPEERHLGPMAQDFHEAFGLGSDKQRIAPMDAAAVAMVGVQELHKQVTERDLKIEHLEKRLSVLEEMIIKLSANSGNNPVTCLTLK